MSVFDQVFSTTGFDILVVVVFGIMLFISAADLFLTVFKYATVGQFVNAAVKTRHWVAVVTAAVFGAMVAHFFIYIAK